MKRWLMLTAWTWTWGFGTAQAQDQPGSDEPLSAREAVRQGNRMLMDGDTDGALAAYEHARSLRPDAHEIPFVQGLGHFAKQEYDAARDAFEKAATSRDRALAGDALYSIGTCYHKEALESVDDPKHAVEKLESAIQRYQTVLDGQEDHSAARDAIFKAATMRRRLKKIIDEQEQQREQEKDGSDGQNEDEESSDQEQESRDGQQSDDQDQQSRDQQQQDQSPEDQQGEQQDQEPSSSSDESDKKQDEQQQSKQRQQDVSKEQAQRRQREMMQALRERLKQRRRPVRPMPVAPVEKDW